MLVCSMLLLGNLATVLLYSCRCNAGKHNYCSDLQYVRLSVQDNGGLEPQPVLNQTVYAKALILTIATSEVKYECQRHGFSPFVSAAYAMCKDPNNERGYYINETRIFLDRDYDTAHPAGADIKDLCVQKGNDYYLTSAPDDTSGTYTFSVQLAYEQTFKRVKDTLLATTGPLKLRK